jgi:hypothetical protein
MMDNVPRRRRSNRMVLQRQRRRSSLLSLRGSVIFLDVVCQLIHHPTVGAQTELRRSHILRVLYLMVRRLSFQGHHIQG